MKRPPSPQWPSWHSADLAPALRPKQPRHPPKMRNQSQPRGEEERLTKKPPRRRRRRRQRRWRRQRRQERPRNVAAQKVRTREKKRPLAFFGEIFSAALKLKTTFSAKPFREKLFSFYLLCCSLPMEALGWIWLNRQRAYFKYARYKSTNYKCLFSLLGRGRKKSIHTWYSGWLDISFQQRPKHLSLKVPNVEFNFYASVDSRQCLTDTTKSKSTFGTHVYAMIRNHHFDFEVRFWPISAHTSKT